MATKEEVELVIARLRSIPEDAVLSIGAGMKPMNRDDLIREVRENSQVGKKIIEMQLLYLRSFKK